MSDLPPPRQPYRAAAVLYAILVGDHRPRRRPHGRRRDASGRRRCALLRARDRLELAPVPPARAACSRRAAASRPSPPSHAAPERTPVTDARRRAARRRPRPRSAPRAGPEAQRGVVADRGAAPDAPQQPRSRGRRASRVARRLRRLGARRALARRATRDRPHASPSPRRRDAARPVRQAGRRLPDACRRAAGAARELAARPRVGVVGRVPAARGGGPDDVRPDDGRLVDLHRDAGDPPGHLPDVLRRGRDALRLARPLGARRSSPPGSGAWAARSRSPRRWRAPRSSASRSTSGRSTAAWRRATSTSRPTISTTRSRGSRAAAAERRPLSVALRANAADVLPELVARGETFDLVTDQTAAHDPLTGYVPAEVPFEEAAALRERDPDEYQRLAAESIVAHVRAMVELVRMGCYVFDYGNNLRGEAYRAGLSEAFTYPGFVPAYIRPLFCRGIGPFRWAALSGDAADIEAIDRELKALFPDDVAAPAVARARAGTGGVPGAAGADLLARLRRPRAGRSRDQRARPLGSRVGAGGDREGSPRLRLGRVAVPRDGGDARRLGRDRRLADPERAPEHGRRRDVGERPPRRRRRDRQLDPRGHGRRRRRHAAMPTSGSSGCSPPTPARA